MDQIVIIGSGTGVPSLRRGSPGLVFLSDSSTVLIDSGSGTLRRMLEVNITYRDIDLLLYTHIHPDHVIDLVPILFASKYGDAPREKDLICLGGPGFKRYFNKVKRTYGSWIESKAYRLFIKELTARPLRFRHMKILSKPMAHMPESVGYRMELKSGKSIAVSGDTDYCENLIDLASGVDLLVLECSFPDERKMEGHLTPTLAGKIASESRCKRLLLTHLYPICDQHDILQRCRQFFHGEVILAEDLMKIEI
jgi:ribonuclease BN (tRNA processing enzyme)